MAPPFLRPPGALSEKDLQARCVSCGRCVAACVYSCIEMRPDHPFFGGETPRVIQGRKPCFLCMRCGPACPTEALRPVSMQEAGMGLAYLDRKRCVDYQTSSGVMCWTCYERCPLKSSAIYLRNGYIPTVDKDKCVGCGVCEYVCPIQAITVTPARMLPGKDKTQGAAAKDKGPDAQKAGIKELAVKLARLILGKGAGGA